MSPLDMPTETTNIKPLTLGDAEAISDAFCERLIGVRQKIAQRVYMRRREIAEP